MHNKATELRRVLVRSWGLQYTQLHYVGGTSPKMPGIASDAPQGLGAGMKQRVVNQAHGNA
jgi:hypothetical protein